jgi:hypothetical protein
VYGVQPIAEQVRNGNQLSPSTLAPNQHGRKAAGNPRCEGSVVDGKVRKYDTATEGGRRALNEALAKIIELVDED